MGLLCRVRVAVIGKNSHDISTVEFIPWKL